MFQIHERLEADSYFVARHAGCQIRLIDDSRFFWLLLVPETPDLRELHDLADAPLTEVIRLAAGLGRALQAMTGADKVNTAAIGNLVAQLHIHIVARHRDDPAWPQPVWGFGSLVPLAESDRMRRIAQVQSMLPMQRGIAG